MLACIKKHVRGGDRGGWAQSGNSERSLRLLAADSRRPRLVYQTVNGQFCQISACFWLERGTRVEAVECMLSSTDIFDVSSLHSCCVSWKPARLSTPFAVHTLAPVQPARSNWVVTTTRYRVRVDLVTCVLLVLHVAPMQGGSALPSKTRRTGLLAWAGGLPELVQATRCSEILGGRVPCQTPVRRGQGTLIK